MLAAAIDVDHEPVPETLTVSPVASLPPAIVVALVVLTLMLPCGEPVFRTNALRPIAPTVPDVEMGPAEEAAAAAVWVAGRRLDAAEEPAVAPPPPPHAVKLSVINTQINSCFIATLQSAPHLGPLTYFT